MYTLGTCMYVCMYVHWNVHTWVCVQVCLYINMSGDVIESSISSVIGGTSNIECEGCLRCGGIHQSTYVCAAYLQ